MQNGGCDAVDGYAATAGRSPARRSSTSRRTSPSPATNETIFPPYEMRKVGSVKIAFIGLTLEGTPTIVTPTGVAGLEFHARGRRPSTRS